MGGCATWYACDRHMRSRPISRPLRLQSSSIARLWLPIRSSLRAILFHTPGFSLWFFLAFPTIGNQVGQIVAAALAGNDSVGVALEKAQTATERVGEQNGSRSVERLGECNRLRLRTRYIA